MDGLCTSPDIDIRFWTLGIWITSPSINLILEKNETGTNVSVKINLKLSLKAIFLQPIIKKWYKRILTSSLYKMNNLINNNQ